MTKGMIMNMLAKFDPFTRTEHLDLFQPSFRADTFRDMDDIVRNMQRTFPPLSDQAEELMTHMERKAFLCMSEDETKY